MQYMKMTVYQLEVNDKLVDLLCEHRDAAVAVATGDISSVRYRVQHAWRYAGRSSVLGSKESTRKAVKIRNNMIYWGKRD